MMNLAHTELLVELTETHQELAINLTNRLVGHEDRLFEAVATGKPGTEEEANRYILTFRQELQDMRNKLIRYQAAASRLGDETLIATAVALNASLERLDCYAVRVLQRAYQIYFAAKRQPTM